MSALHALIRPARAETNRQNAAKSTGPKTDAGKARSRGNALKHGLTGAGIALPTEDAATIAARAEALHAQFQPQTPLTAYHVHRIAVAMVRTDRLEKHETAALANRVAQAVLDYDRARIAFADQAIARLRAGDARAGHTDCIATPEGITRLLVELSNLRRCLELAQPLWSDDHAERLDACLGVAFDPLLPSRVLALSGPLTDGSTTLLLHRDHAAIRDAKLTPAAFARRELASLIDRESKALEADMKAIDLSAIVAERARAADLALFDPSPEAQLARRYEAAARREIDRSVRFLLDADADADAEITPATTPTPAIEEETAPSESAEPIEDDDCDSRKASIDNELLIELASFGDSADGSALVDPLGPGVVAGESGLPGRVS